MPCYWWFCTFMPAQPRRRTKIILTASLLVGTIVTVLFFITSVMAWNAIGVVEFVNHTGKLPGITFGSSCKRKRKRNVY
jgi:hypothetical protein